MSDDKTKVKDLATELNVSTKDILRVLRELDIPVRSSVSSIPVEDLARVRSRFMSNQPGQDAERREIQPGVIVRRRRSPKEADAGGSVLEGSAPEESVKEGSIPEDGAEEHFAPEGSVRKDADSTSPTSSPATEVVARGLTPNEAPRYATAGKRPSTDAKIVRHPAVVTEAKPVFEPTAQLVADAVSPTAASVSPASEAPTHKVPADETDAAKAEANKNNKAKNSAASEKAGENSERPAGEGRSTGEGRSAGEARPAGEGRSRKRAAARVVTTAKVISRPPTEAEIAAAEAAEAETRRIAQKAEAEAETARKAATHPAENAPEHKTRRTQPAASARPEGSSAPSLLPPVSSEGRGDIEGETEEERRERRGRRRPQESSSPQVRIISRPDPTAPAPRPAEASRDGNRGGYRPGGQGQQPGGYRPGGQGQQPGGYRPGGQGQQPGGYRPAGTGTGPGGPGGYRPAGGPGGPRPAGPGGAPRPGGFAPSGVPVPEGGPEGGREGQSKKKRNKGRRTVDFQQADAGALSRRRDDEDSDMPRSRGRRRNKRDTRHINQQSTQPLKAAKRKLRVEEAIRVADMAHQMGLKSSEIIKVLFNLGIMATINKALDIDTATVVAAEFGYEVEKVGFAEEDYLAPTPVDAPGVLQLRPPVVTIMGHVDHGKTSLLDAIRKTNVTGGEAGGITQHIGAYHVSTKRGEIVFLDTPGHEAFTAMRARGAQVTDLVVLVVAADDGVMEQTREAVNHARAAGVPIMVAVNKIDKPDANPDRVLRELADIGLVAEDWGGDTVISKVSAKTREGLDDLLELLALQADILELKANPEKPARGHIVEAKLDKGRGPVATVLVQEGTLHQGDTFVCGVFSGRVRAMFNDQGRKIKDAGPSIPVEVQGFEGVPEAGEEFICLADEKLARRIAESRAVKQRERELAKESRVTLETFLSRKADDQEALTLNLVVKSDVQGSLEAILEALNKQSTDKVRIQIIHGGTGAITESDILLATASDAIIIGFNVRPTAKVKEMAEHENVDIRFYDIIYKLVDEIKNAMAGLLAPVSREVYLGQADVREVFSVPKIGSVAGSHVSDGKLIRNAGVRLLRDSVVIYTGKILSLRRFKDDVKEVQKGYECGIGLENYNDIKPGDVIEAFEMVEEAATL